MSARDQLKSEITNKAVVHGKVILSSGKEADYYVDLRRITLDHVAAPLVGEVMLRGSSTSWSLRNHFTGKSRLIKYICRGDFKSSFGQFIERLFSTFADI